MGARVRAEPRGGSPSLALRQEALRGGTQLRRHLQQVDGHRAHKDHDMRTCGGNKESWPRAGLRSRRPELQAAGTHLGPERLLNPKRQNAKIPNVKALPTLGSRGARAAQTTRSRAQHVQLAIPRRWRQWKRFSALRAGSELRTRDAAAPPSRRDPPRPSRRRRQGRGQGGRRLAGFGKPHPSGRSRGRRGGVGELSEQRASAAGRRWARRGEPGSGRRG